MTKPSTTHIRSTAEKNRKTDQGAKMGYPFLGGLNPDDITQTEIYLAKFNAALADVMTGMMHNGLRPGMAGYADERANGKGYALPTPGMDNSPAGIFLKRV